LAERQDWGGDQADGLRRLFGCREPQVVAFASGREACGRTTLVIQTAVALAATGQAVVVVDENPAPDNVVTAFGLSARNDFFQVVRGDRNLGQVALTAAPLVRVIPSARAARDLDHMSVIARQHFEAGFQAMQEGAGFVLIDCAANRRAGHLSPLAALARHFVVVVATQGPAITHAYALIKKIFQDYGRDRFQIAVTRARSPEEARAVYDNMRRVAREHLGVHLDYLGASAVPVTDHLADALLRKLPESGDRPRAEGFLTVPRGVSVRSDALDSVL
jgi:flagellar biosynthesis protein FlhG